jgi:energy-coupling factor transporter ATP-binding protein EcfA2
MHLSRVQVPDFRVLKAIDITFEPHYIPRIFPLGSLNGGGKSTLLQLIFTLLHCTGDRHKHNFIQNLLYGYLPKAGAEPRTVAQFSLEQDGQTYELEFLVYRNAAIQALLASDRSPSDDLQDYYFSCASYAPYSDAEKPICETVQTYLNQNHLHYITDYRLTEKPYLVRSFWLDQKPGDGFDQTDLSTSAIPSNQDYGEGVLLVRIQGLTAQETQGLLDHLSPRLFLAAPSTQVFLFSAPESRRKLLKDIRHSDYETDLCKIERDLDHFFPYRFLSVNLLVTLFKLARDKDFNKVMGSQPGNPDQGHVQQLLTELSTILGKGILVKPNADLSEAIFELQEHDRLIQLQPEDLSHGELKRLSIFMWLKYYQMNNAIVLMDEPEIAFHPDWQYQIVQDLLNWAPNNQYILATHSYEVCQALTPGHVKELEISPFLGA